MAKPKPWFQSLDREPGTMTDKQRSSIESLLPDWRRAHVRVGVLDNFSSDWMDCSAFDAQQIIFGMRAVIRDLLSRPAVQSV